MAKEEPAAPVVRVAMGDLAGRVLPEALGVGGLIQDQLVLRVLRAQSEVSVRRDRGALFEGSNYRT